MVILAEFFSNNELNQSWYDWIRKWVEESRIGKQNKIIEKRIKDNLPFLSAEYVITESVKKGYDRQEIHELFRETSMEALKKIKNGENIDLIKMLTESKKIPLKSKDIEEILTPEKMTGRAEEQVLEYLDFVDKILNRNKILIENLNFDLKV